MQAGSIRGIVAILATHTSHNVVNLNTEQCCDFRYIQNMEMHEWLQKAIAFANLSQSELARRLTDSLGRPVDRAAVQKMTKPGGRRIKADELLAIVAITGYPLSEDNVPSGELEPVPLEENNGNGYHDGWKPSVPGGLPQLDARAGAGAGEGALGAVVTLGIGGITSGHLVTQEWVVPRSVLGTAPARVFALPVDGTSMEPGLSTDDVVFVEPTERIKSGEIYVIDDGDGPMVKRLRIDRNDKPPRLWITSDNPAVPDFWRPLEAVRVIGQVIGKFVRMRSR